MKSSNDLMKRSFSKRSKITDDSVNKSSLQELDNEFSKKSSEVIDKFISHYDARNAHNRGLRIAFFVLSFLALMIVIGSLAAFTILVAIFREIKVGEVVSLFGACGTIITSIIVLPKLVGNNLFPKKEDEDILKFVQEMSRINLEFAKVKLERVRVEQGAILVDKDAEVKEEIESIKMLQKMNTNCVE